MTEEKSKMGRPTSYTPEIGKLICDGLASGKSLRRVCEDEAMPHKATVVRWLLRIEDPMFDDFRAQYASARAVQYELMVDDVVDIADDSTNDYVLQETSEGAELAKFNPEAVARARLRVNTRKWFLSKVLPKFADKQQVDHTSSDGSMTPKGLDASKLSTEALAEIMAAADAAKRS